jgi:hypothetical protein
MATPGLTTECPVSMSRHERLSYALDRLQFFFSSFLAITVICFVVPALGTNTYMAMQRLASHYGYTGPIDGALGPNSYRGVATYFNTL